MNTTVAQRLLELLHTYDAAARITATRLLKLVQETLADELHVYADGRMLIWDIARHDGYNIPPYPMAGCGDVKEFLAAEGARNVPDWYERHLGITRAMYAQIYRYRLVMVRNRAWWRRVDAVDVGVFEDVSALARNACEWVGFSLGRLSDADDPRLFRR